MADDLLIILSFLKAQNESVSHINNFPMTASQSHGVTDPVIPNILQRFSSDIRTCQSQFRKNFLELMNFLGIQVSLFRMCSSSWGKCWNIQCGVEPLRVITGPYCCQFHIIGLRETFTSAKLRRQVWDGSRSGIMHTSRLLRQTEGTIQSWCCLSCDKTLRRRSP